MDLEHLFEGARLAFLVVFATIALAEVGANNSCLEALTVFLLAIGLLAVAPFEMPLLLITCC